MQSMTHCRFASNVSYARADVANMTEKIRETREIVRPLREENVVIGSWKMEVSGQQKIRKLRWSDVTRRDMKAKGVHREKRQQKRDVCLVAIQVLRRSRGWRCSDFPEKKRFEDVRFNVISVTRGWVGVTFPEKKRYVTLEGKCRRRYC